MACGGSEGSRCAPGTVSSASTLSCPSPISSPPPPMGLDTGPAVLAKNLRLNLDLAFQLNLGLKKEDSQIIKEVRETHAPDGSEFNLRLLLQIVDDILEQVSATPTVPDSNDIEDQANVDAMINKILPLVKMMGCEVAGPRTDNSTEELASISWSSSRLGSFITEPDTGKEDTLFLLKMLSKYGWEAKLPLSLAALAWKYGEIWLLAEVYQSSQLATSVGILKQIPAMVEDSGNSKIIFDALSNLIQTVIDMAWWILKLKELPPNYITEDDPHLSKAMGTVPSALYWSIRSIMFTASVIKSFLTMDELYRPKSEMSFI
ncbi:hypothetical protein RJ639_036414 [Escallonia herrerae]|uniref:Sieve element occlusion N-terminal domain-containing protein n=1 Tax=Escallonia herrerae TaxID=1293975 RepID=A0AA88WR73_9ASTE|nr:hypothetical protein RJ639_036414 [Escallonia herrerae]